MIIARTDARAVEGVERALERGRMYREAGADALFIEAVVSQDEAEEAVRAFPDVPLLFNWAEGGKTPPISLDRLNELGYRIVIFPISTLLAATAVMRRILQEIAPGGYASRGDARAADVRRVRGFHRAAGHPFILTRALSAWLPWQARPRLQRRPRVTTRSHDWLTRHDTEPPKAMGRRALARRRIKADHSRVTSDTREAAAQTEGASPVIKYVYEIDYPLGQKRNYLEWVRSIGDTLQAPGELKRLASYDNIFSATPHRVVEFTFDSLEDAARYFERREISLIFQSELPAHGVNIAIKVLALRGDYSEDAAAG